MPAPPGQPALIRGWGVACEEVSSAYESSNLEDNGFVSPAPAGRPSSGSWMSHDLTFFRNGVHSSDFRLLIYEVDTLPPYHPQHGLMVSVGVWSGPAWRAAPPLGLSPEIPLVLNSHVFGDFSQKPEEQCCAHLGPTLPVLLALLSYDTSTHTHAHMQPASSNWNVVN